MSAPPMAWPASQVPEARAPGHAGREPKDHWGSACGRALCRSLPQRADSATRSAEIEKQSRYLLERQRRFLSAADVGTDAWMVFVFAVVIARSVSDAFFLGSDDVKNDIVPSFLTSG